jgi:eukaryotic-like serine/threonine-protein kinase
MSTKIGHFEILSELAKSATGTVYKANDPQTSQTVALKVIQLSAFGERAGQLEKALLEETEAIKALSHPNLAPVHGAGEIDGQFLAAMEYIQGNSIATMLARKEGFSIWDLLDIGRQVCSGLDHAQSQNVFHFSLKPSKIMCGWDGTVRILGYGISSVGKFAGQMAGVPSLLHYMSPEQVRGENIDARSNLFSLGAIFYEMATDRKAFDGEDSEFLRRSILEAIPVPPMVVNPKLHPALSDLILKAIAKDPAARYQNGRELLDDLEKCKESKPHAAKQPVAPAKSVALPQAVKIASQTKFAGASPAAVGRQAASGRSEEAKPAENKTAMPGVAAKAAASAAGWSGGQSAASATVKPTSNAGARPSPSMSSATLDGFPADTGQPPRFAVDPLMAESAPARGGSVSFSEMTELPPLQEVYSAPPPPPPPLEAQAPQSGKPAGSEGKAEKPKLQTREVAAKAVNEVKNVPPRLIGYSVAVASALILIVALALYLRINGLNNDGDSGRPSASSATQVSRKPAAAPSQPAQTEPLPPAETADAPLPEPTNDSDAGPWVPTAAPKGKSARKKSATTTTAAVIPGQMVIDSTPQGAQVQIDGKTDPSWVTPLTLSGLAAGQHSVTFSKPGYSTDARTVTVRSGSKASIASRLTQTVATLVVTSNPAGANIYLDGRNTGKLTPAQISVEKGQHVILVRKSGFIDDTTNAQFILGQTITFSPALRPLGNVDDIRTVGKMKKLFGGKEAQGMGTVSIKTQPRGAQIAVNQHMLEKQSPVDIMLDPGNYIVDITISGYAPIHKIITVERGGKAVIDEAFQSQ